MSTTPLNTHPNAHPGGGAYTNAAQVAAELRGIGKAAVAKSAALTRHYGMLLQTKIKANASGRPGPRAITGDYRRSWGVTFERAAGTVIAVVGTNKPQARRLEYGFVGQDRIGRHYNQPPFPHVGPAADEVLPAFETAMSEELL